MAVTATVETLDKEAVEALCEKHGEWKKTSKGRVLVKMKKNRKAKRPRIKALIAEMLAGEWENTGQGLIWSTRKQLIDGQNRLIAMYEALQVNPKLKFDVLCVHGVKPDAFKKLDGGTPRTLADAIFCGADAAENKDLFKEHAGSVAQLARYIYLRTNGKELNASFRIPPHRVMDFIQKEHPEALVCLAEVLEVMEDAEAKERLKTAPVAFWAAFQYLASYTYATEEGYELVESEQKDLAAAFIACYAHNVTAFEDIGNDNATAPTANHPLGRLYKTLIAGNSDGSAFKPHIKFGCIVNAFQAWAEGEDTVRSVIPGDACPRLDTIDLSQEDWNERFLDPEEQEESLEEDVSEDTDVDPLFDPELVEEEPEEEKPKRARKRVSRTRKK